LLPARRRGRAADGVPAAGRKQNGAQPPRIALQSKAGLAAASKLARAADSEQGPPPQQAAPQAGALSVEEQRRRKRAERFAEGAADPAAGGSSATGDEEEAAEDGAAAVRAPAPAQPPAAVPEQMRRLKRAERFGCDGAGDGEGGASAKRAPSLLGRALGAVLTVATDEEEQPAKRSRVAAIADCPPPTPLRRIQNEKLGLAARHQKEMAELKRRHKTEMRALERRELDALADAVSEAKGGANPCATCRKKVRAGQFFVCAECAAPVCNSHKQGMNECSECHEHYCDDCVEKIDKCQQCAIPCQLVCCGLRKMPCGDFACGGCSDSHWTRCSCRAEGDALPDDEEEEEEEGEEGEDGEDGEGGEEDEDEEEAEEEEGWGYHNGLDQEEEWEEEWEEDEDDEDGEEREPRNIRLRVDKAAAFRCACMGSNLNPSLQRTHAHRRSVYVHIHTHIHTHIHSVYLCMRNVI